MRNVAHFIPIKTTYLASEVAEVLIGKIVRLHSVLNKIVSYMDAYSLPVV